MFLNRELTWLEFNRRVLNEAKDERTPLLERVKFIAIVSSNLDEFFMKRIGGLKQQLGAGMNKLTVDGRTPQQQIEECYEVVKDIEATKRIVFNDLKIKLQEYDICIKQYNDLSKTTQSKLRAYYFKNIYPLITPQSIDPAHPFPFISNLSLNLLVYLKYPGKSAKFSLARIKVPVGAGIPRFIQIDDKNYFVPLDEVISHNLDLLFPEMEIISCQLFRVTRNANTERNEENADDLLSMIESELRDRRLAPIVRMEAEKGMDVKHRGMLAAEMGLNGESDVFEVDGLMSMRDLFEVAAIDINELHDTPHQPFDHAELKAKSNIFHIIRDEGPLLLQHPYESFTTTVERFLREASTDPKVRAIKMTLYRTSQGTKVIDYLIQAAQNGKQIAVVVELKARFDEAANIIWASRMEEAGVHVTYGVVGLKTHSKIILVVRQDYSGIKRYVHIGTGNYHAGTARLYSDLGMLTNDDVIGQDASELFNYLTTGYSPKRLYHKILPAPNRLKPALLEKIEREINVHKEKGNGLIQFKMNALEDVDVTRSLYRASMMGVKIDLIIRDTCRLRPGIPGLSETVSIISIVGRFLEHTRIFYFKNDGNEEYFIGSADCMKRNLEQRVEVVAPVESPGLRKHLRSMLDCQLNDQRSAWEMKSDGIYVQRSSDDEKQQVGSQELQIEWAKKRENKSLGLQRWKVKKRRGRGRNVR